MVSVSVLLLPLAVLLYQVGVTWWRLLFFTFALALLLQQSAEGFSRFAGVFSLPPVGSILINLVVFMVVGVAAAFCGLVPSLDRWSRRPLAKVTVGLLTVVCSVYLSGLALDPGSGGPGPGPGTSAGPSVGDSDTKPEDTLGTDHPFSRDELRSVQRALRELGFYEGAIDGTFGAQSSAALREWQSTQASVPTGVLDESQGRALIALAPERESAPGNLEPGPVPDLPESGARIVVRTQPGSSICLGDDPCDLADAAGVATFDGVQPGQHLLVADRSGFEGATLVVDVVAELSQVVELRLAALPGSLSVRANVAGARVELDGGSSRPLPLADLEVPAGPREVVVRRVGYAPVVRTVEVRPGETTRVDVDLEPMDPSDDVEVLRAQFDGGDYTRAARGARTLADLLVLWQQAGLEVDAPLASALAILGRSLYELGRFEESLEPLHRAILLGEQIVFQISHRHGGGGLRPGFCRGYLSLRLTEIAFRSIDDPDHGFAVTPQGLTRLAATEHIGGQLFRLDTEVRGRGGVDFVHPAAERRREDPDSPLLTVLVCPRCDASLALQAELLRRLSRP